MERVPPFHQENSSVLAQFAPAILELNDAGRNYDCARRKYGKAVERARLDWKGIETAEVRFFYGTNMKEIKSFSLHTKTKAKAKAIVEKWLQVTT